MRILIDGPETGVAKGIANTLRILGHQISIYKPDEKPAFDIFDETEPQIHIHKTEFHSRAVEKCHQERNRLRVYCYEWFRPAADPIALAQGGEGLACKVSIIANHEPKYERFVYPLCDSVIDAKIYGTGWLIPECVGALEPDAVGSALRSSKISLNLDGPMAPELVYQILYFGLFCVSVPLRDEWCENERFLTMPPRNQLADEVKRAAVCPSAVDKRTAKRGMEYVRANHTYFHRVAQMFSDIKMGPEAQRTLSYYENLRL